MGCDAPNVHCLCTLSILRTRVVSRTYTLIVCLCPQVSSSTRVQCRNWSHNDCMGRAATNSESRLPDWTCRMCAKRHRCSTRTTCTVQGVMIIGSKRGGHLSCGLGHLETLKFQVGVIHLVCTFVIIDAKESNVVVRSHCWCWQLN